MAKNAVLEKVTSEEYYACYELALQDPLDLNNRNVLARTQAKCSGDGYSLTMTTFRWKRNVRSPIDTEIGYEKNSEIANSKIYEILKSKTLALLNPYGFFNFADSTGKKELILGPGKQAQSKI